MAETGYKVVASSVADSVDVQDQSDTEARTRALRPGGDKIAAGEIAIYSGQIRLQRDEEIVLDGELIPDTVTNAAKLVTLPAFVALGLNASGVLGPLEALAVTSVTLTAAQSEQFGVHPSGEGFATSDRGTLILAREAPAPSAASGVDAGEVGPPAMADGSLWTAGAVSSSSSWITDGSLAADFTSAEIDTYKYPNVNISLQFADDAAGTLHVQQSDTSGSHFEDIILDAYKVYYEVAGVAWTGVTFTGPDGTITIADPGAGGSKVGLNLTNTKRYVRIFFDRTGGGAAGIDGQYSLRAMA